MKFNERQGTQERLRSVPLLGQLKNKKKSQVGKSGNKCINNKKTGNKRKFTTKRSSMITALSNCLPNVVRIPDNKPP